MFMRGPYCWVSYEGSYFRRAGGSLSTAGRVAKLAAENLKGRLVLLSGRQGTVRDGTIPACRHYLYRTCRQSARTWCRLADVRLFSRGDQGVLRISFGDTVGGHYDQEAED